MKCRITWGIWWYCAAMKKAPILRCSTKRGGRCRAFLFDSQSKRRRHEPTRRGLGRNRRRWWWRRGSDCGLGLLGLRNNRRRRQRLDAHFDNGWRRLFHHGFSHCAFSAPRVVEGRLPDER